MSASLFVTLPGSFTGVCPGGCWNYVQISTSTDLIAHQTFEQLELGLLRRHCLVPVDFSTKCQLDMKQTKPSRDSHNANSLELLFSLHLQAVNQKAHPNLSQRQQYATQSSWRTKHLLKGEQRRVNKESGSLITPNGKIPFCKIPAFPPTQFLSSVLWSRGSYCGKTSTNLLVH